MPSNPHAEANECFKYIDKVFTKGLTGEGMLYKDLIRNCLLKFQLSERAVKHFVDEYYISTGEVNNKDGTLFKGGS